MNTAGSYIQCKRDLTELLKVETTKITVKNSYVSKRNKTFVFVQ